MPLPSPNKNEKRSDFVSRCVSKLTKMGEGKDRSQRVAICNSQFKKAKAGEILLEEEVEALASVIPFNSGRPVNPNQKRKKFKRPKDKFRKVRDEEVGSAVTGQDKKKKKKKKNKPSGEY